MGVPLFSIVYKLLLLVVLKMKAGLNILFTGTCVCVLVCVSLCLYVPISMCLCVYIFVSFASVCLTHTLTNSHPPHPPPLFSDLRWGALAVFTGTHVVLTIGLRLEVLYADRDNAVISSTVV